MDKVDTAQHVPPLNEQLISRLEASNTYEQFLHDFSACKKESEKIACVYKLPEIEGLLKVKERFRCKDKKEAELYRAEGNKCFKVKNYQKALQFYTFSILKAPRDSENLSLAYNNRSLTNFYMKQYVLCLQDIELAFLHQYPKKSCYKLYQRIGRCMYHLHHREEAVKAFHQTIVTLECADINQDTKDEMVEDMNRAVAQCSAITGRPLSISVKNINRCHEPVPKLSTSVSAEVPCLSDAVEIRLDSHGGRGLFANKDINIGDVLIVENPFSSLLLKEYNLSHCHYCCNRLFLAIPCHGCSGVAFCSLDCRKSAWEKFHGVECQILESLHDKKGDLGLLATRMVLTAGYDMIVSMETTEEVERAKGFSQDGCYSSDSYDACCSLVHHMDSRSFKDLLARTLSAIFYLKHLELVGFFSVSKRNSILYQSDSANSSNENSNVKNGISGEEINEEVLFTHKCAVGGHILRNIMMLPCNAHEVSELDLNAENPAMSATRELAAAIYPVLSLINHSCDPSVVRHSFGNICVARAIRSIKSGQELKDNYGALYPTMDLATRQDNMKSQYYFNCSCEACVDDWPLYFNIPCEDPVLKCPKCDGRVVIPRMNSSESIQCDKCCVGQDMSTDLLKMGQMEPSYRATLMEVIEGNVSEENVRNLLRYLQLVEGKIHRPWRDINDCQEALKQCLSMQANCYSL